MRRPVDPNQSFPALEQQVLDRWRERDVFRESLRRREGAEPWVFYEGPPTANGRPGSHHVLSRAFKDVFPRFQTMRGRYVERKGGWDCHGLPVEITVEKELGLRNKAEIEAYGIAEFNARCRASVSTYLEEWDRLTERIGYWVDLGDAYRTMDPQYVERVWGAIRTIADAGLLYEGHRVVPYCPRCGTALSSHEVAQGYEDVVDTSAYVRFPVTDVAGSALREGDAILAWTTTPWTLVSNAALAVHPGLEYVRARVRPAAPDPDGPKAKRPDGLSDEGEVVVVAAGLLERVAGPGTEVEVLERLPGERLVGAHYRPPFSFIPTSDWGERGHTVLPADFVTAEDGTGIVHTAVAFGADDYALGTAAGLTVVNPVGLDGAYDERITGYAGRQVKDADADLVEDLRASGALWRAQPYEHSYPHCWRCGTALLYYAKPSWYIATSRVRDALLAANERITWHPEHVKHGRFGNWLEGNVDWALSRERYWGTPLPVWRCDDPGCDHDHVIGAFDELSGLSGTPVDDPHRPYVDDLTWPCPGDCDGTMRRVPEVIDVWFDSGSMPFAQHGESLATVAEEGRWPAQYICEAQDQTRGWFYSLLAIAVLLQEAGALSGEGDRDGTRDGTLRAVRPADAAGEGGGQARLAPTDVRPPYEDVVCLGLLTDEDGKKMSKSRGNVVVPWEVLDRYGADAFRWYLFTSKQPWDGYRFSLEAIGEGVRLFLRTLWNTYGFLVMYENAAAGAAAPAEPAERDPEDPGALMDRWIRSRLAATVRTTGDRLEAFDATFSGRAVAEFVDDLSNWYVRRSRRRFWEGDPAALATLRECLVTVAKLLAPFCPFVADELFDNLDGGEPSVHLADWPLATDVGVGDADDGRDDLLEEQMAVARDAVRLGLAARGQSKLKVRQPLHEAVVVAADRERAAIRRLGAVVRDELNVHELRFVEDADELGTPEIKANYRALGPRFGKRMPQVAEALAALDADHVAQTLRGGGTVGVHLEGQEHELGPDDVLLRMEPLEGYQLEREGSHAVALELRIDDALRREGLAREVVHAVQAARKGAGLDVSDRIGLVLDGDADLVAAASEHRDVIASEVLATSIAVGEAPAGDVHETVVDGYALRVGVTRA